jgi:phosphoribosyl 1,2-cyclic phosphodiesterase
MRVTFWGVRGSIATSGLSFARFGGNTTCLEIEDGGQRLIIDAGTGIRGLGHKIVKEARTLGRPPRAAILFTHLHWDHIQGFPFFGPALAPGAALSLYGPRADDGGSLEGALAAQMRPPSFPITLADMPATKRFAEVGDGDAFEVEGMTVRTRRLLHPQGSIGYRVEAGGRAICFATDTEHPSDGSIDEALLDLARDVDLLIYDAQYTQAEYDGREGPSRKGWGHSTYVEAARIARASGARRLVLTHHDPGHDDATVEAIEREARSLFSACRAAREQLPIAV